ncbi:hypothetical protein BGZ58_001468 [Dissophora ornata]|nr:hypothetical protein BGZ58_001468 [Dissophora ornata]
MPPSPVGPIPGAHHSPETYQAKRHRIDSDSEGYSDHEARYRHRHDQIHDSKSLREREPYHTSPYQYADPTPSKSHGYADPSRDHHSMSMYPASAPPDGLPALAPRPSRYSMEEDSGSNNAHRMQQHPMHTQIKREAASGTEPFKIQSARGTPKGPLPIDVQIGLLSSVLKHDPFNCAIRKTTQAWELISREQGIRARTCSRRFDNIIQASIAGRDRPVGTEEQQATKKKLLEQLFEMMNQPQALKRMQKKRRYRSEDTDRRLLQETIRLNPFAQKVGQVAKAWEDVRDALNMKVHARQCIRRVNRMVKPYQLRERMYKGNIPEEMKEANDDLVKQVIQLMRSAGQGGTLDDACNSNDEDSNSCLSDSDEQDHDDHYMDSKAQENAQEDDELEEDEDEDMLSRSESEQRNAQRTQDDSAQHGATTPISPTAPSQNSPSTQATTPSLSASTSGHASAPTTPAKRGRPRNPVSTAQPNRPASRSSLDRTRHAPAHSNRAWEGENESKTSRPLTNGNLEDGSVKQTTPLSSPLPAHSPSAASLPGSGHARHYSQGEYVDSNEYKRHAKHARTSSRGPDMSIDSVRAHHGRDREEPGYRYGHHAGRGSAIDSRGRPILPPSSTHDITADGYNRRGHHAGPEEAADSLMSPSPTAQQYRDMMNELRGLRERLVQMDEFRRVEIDKQASMMYTMEKLQIQMQQQQQQLSHLQNQLRYGYSSQSHQQAPPPHSPHHSHQQPHSQGPPGTAPTSGGPPSGGRYPPQMDGRPSDRQGPEMTHHVSYSRSDSHYPPRDRDLR